MKERILFVGRKLAFPISLSLLSLLSLFGDLLPQTAAQGTDIPIYQTLQTGQTQALQTATQYLTLDQTKPTDLFEFSFFFATQEQPSPGQFLDSATIMLQNGAQTTAVVFLTVDASGVYWVPATPGGLDLDPASMVMTPLSYRDQSQPWQLQTAYSITVPLPEQLKSGAAILTLDLFDNGNSLKSMAWISQIPEPGSTALLICGGLMLSLNLMRRSRRG
jgi:hypothetical protein